LSDSADKHLAKYLHKIIHAEKLKSTVHKLAKTDAHGPATLPSHTSKRHHQNLKKAEMNYGISTGWYFTFGEGGNLKQDEIGFLKVQKQQLSRFWDWTVW